MPATIEHHAQFESSVAAEEAHEFRTRESKGSIWKEIIKFDKDFIKQMKEMSKYYDAVDLYDFKHKFTLSLWFLLSINPDKLSFELTSEKSAFYTIKKNEYTLFFQYYFHLEDEDDDEALLSIYRNEEKQPSEGGSYSNIINSIANRFQYKDLSYGVTTI